MKQASPPPHSGPLLKDNFSLDLKSLQKAQNPTNFMNKRYMVLKDWLEIKFYPIFTFEVSGLPSRSWENKMSQYWWNHSNFCCCIESTMLKGNIQPKILPHKHYFRLFHLLPRRVVSVNLKNIKWGKVFFLGFNTHYFSLKSNLI